MSSFKIFPVNKFFHWVRCPLKLCRWLDLTVWCPVRSNIPCLFVIKKVNALTVYEVHLHHEQHSGKCSSVIMKSNQVFFYIAPNANKGYLKALEINELWMRFQSMKSMLAICTCNLSPQETSFLQKSIYEDLNRGLAIRKKDEHPVCSVNNALNSISIKCFFS